MADDDLYSDHMNQVRVALNSGGMIRISQDCPMQDTAEIVIAPCQVDTVIEWLREAKAEAERQQAA